MLGAEQTDLENFLLDINCLNELNPWIDDVNIFEILKVSKTEIRHSNFLAWLLNPNEKHSFGDRIIKDIVCHLIKDGHSDIDKAFTIFNATTLWDYTSFNVYRERYNIDIMLVSNTLKILICIENKVFSQEHTRQTMRYRNKIDEAYPTYGKLFIFLTPDGDEAFDYEYWVPFTYRDLVNIIEANMALKNLNITIKERIFVENYISGVKRHVMEDMDLQEVCANIYFKHRQALDLIFENKPDMRDFLFSALVDKLENEAASTGNIVFDKSGSYKKLIRFNTPYSLKLFPELAEPRKSDWNTNFMFCYEINIRYYPYRLYAVMNNNNLQEDELSMCEKVSAFVSDKPFMARQWNVFNLSKRATIAETNLDEISLEEFNEGKDSIVNSLFNNTMKVIRAFEDKLKKSGL